MHTEYRLAQARTGVSCLVLFRSSNFSFSLNRSISQSEPITDRPRADANVDGSFSLLLFSLRRSKRAVLLYSIKQRTFMNFCFSLLEFEVEKLNIFQLVIDANDSRYENITLAAWWQVKLIG